MELPRRFLAKVKGNGVNFYDMHVICENVPKIPSGKLRFTTNKWYLCDTGMAMAIRCVYKKCAKRLNLNNGRPVAGGFDAIRLMVVWRGKMCISSMPSSNSSPSIATISAMLTVSLRSYLAIVSWCSQNINISPSATYIRTHLLSQTSQLGERERVRARHKK